MTHLSEVFDTLAGSPKMGRAREELPDDGLRSFPSNTYVIFYVPLTDGVEIVRVLHEQRDVTLAFTDSNDRID